MWSEILESIVSPGVAPLYLGFCVAVVVIPVILYSRMYHARAAQTAGGRRLRDQQRAARPGPSRSQLGKGMQLAREVREGVYGPAMSSLMHHTYRWFIGWLVINVILFGVWIYADSLR